MSRLSDFIRFFAVLLAMLCASPDGSLLCTHFHCQHSASQPPSDPYDHEYDDEEQPAVLVQRSVDESVSPAPNCVADFVSSVPAKCPPEMVGFRDTVTASPSSLSLRLHLLYRSLLI